MSDNHTRNVTLRIKKSYEKIYLSDNIILALLSDNRQRVIHHNTVNRCHCFQPLMEMDWLGWSQNDPAISNQPSSSSVSYLDPFESERKDYLSVFRLEGEEL